MPKNQSIRTTIWNFPRIFSLNHCFEKYKNMNEKLFIAKGVGVPGREYECRVSLLCFWICVFESICIQFPHDIQLHMEFCCMRKNSSNKLYAGTGAWAITEQTTNKETKKRLSNQQENRQKHKILWYRDIDKRFWSKFAGKLLWN